MVDIDALLPDLRKLVLELSKDLHDRVDENSDIQDGLKNAYAQIEKRTASAYGAWLTDYIDQVSVAWVLACVFVRFVEDNALIKECYLAGAAERRNQAEDSLSLFFRDHPNDEYRDYFFYVFREVEKIPACAELFAEGKTPLWAIGPSGDFAMKLLNFWREIDPESGKLVRSFVVENGDTRFLGDLYQELSERARDKFALLQTPVFVEEFILDRTLDPAIEEFGLAEFRIIDPTCGSGHFLLGAFVRLFKLWMKQQDNEIVAAQSALNGVWGVDINPFAVAIARFRLVVAALQACQISDLRKAPAWTLHLAVGDSLLFGDRWTRSGEKVSRQQFLGDDESWAPDIYVCEEPEAIQEVLGQQYHAVVGNPPYITSKDRARRTEYRNRYVSAHDKFHLSTPFTERFFELALLSAKGRAGFVGLIKDNAFMKRDFGKQLIESVLPQIDLTHIVCTDGASLPGHGTPTVILFGRPRAPTSDTIRAVLGIQGEASTPTDPSKGRVWQSILKNIDVANAEDEFTSTSDLQRQKLETHPWILAGGGVTELFDLLTEQRVGRLCDVSKSIGISCFTLEDDAYIIPRHVANKHRLPRERQREMVVGVNLRDWRTTECEPLVFPYDDRFQPIVEDDTSPLFQFLWPFKTSLANSKMFAGKTKVQAGLRWFEYGRLTDSKLRTPLTIAFAFVATHNHFVLDRGGKVFNRSAPIIKLPDDATEEEHHALLGLLNSSTACFWMKQVMNGKHKGDGGAAHADPAYQRFEFAATPLESFPLPEGRPLEIAMELDRLGAQFNALLPENTIMKTTPNRDLLDKAESKATAIRNQMISLQEELDWTCYSLYGLTDQSLVCDIEQLPPTSFGQRAFEILMARQMRDGGLKNAWFERHGASPVTELPGSWSSSYQNTVRSRIRAIESVRNIRVLEKPEFKRRWTLDDWRGQEEKALRSWLLQRLEETAYWGNSPALQTVARLSDRASSDSEFLQVAALYRGKHDFQMLELIDELVTSEAAPILPTVRFKPSGLRKWRMWEDTWSQQRRQEFAKKAPPKYVKGDFSCDAYWDVRGQLDVPKERWCSFPQCETDGDPSLVVGWAGWDQLQTATAIVSYYDARKQEGWAAERLKPLLASLDQLLPWIHQWHPEIDPEYDETAGTSFQTLLESEAQELGLTMENIRSWTPPKKTAKRKKKQS